MSGGGATEMAVAQVASPFLHPCACCFVSGIIRAFIITFPQALKRKAAEVEGVASIPYAAVGEVSSPICVLSMSVP